MDHPPDELTIVQPAALAVHLNTPQDAKAEAWILASFAALFGPMFALMYIGALLGLWAQGRMQEAPWVLLALAALYGLILFSWKFLSKRPARDTILNLSPKRLNFNKGRFIVKWRQVKAFRIQPILNQEGLREVAVVFAWTINDQAVRRMVLSLEQYELLLKYLRQIRTDGLGDFKIELYSQPVPLLDFDRGPIPWRSGVALSLFLAALGLLPTVLLGPRTQTEQAVPKERIELNRFQGTFLRPFQTPEQVVTFFFGAAGVIMLCGATGIYALEHVKTKRWREELNKAIAAHEDRYPPSSVV